MVAFLSVRTAHCRPRPGSTPPGQASLGTAAPQGPCTRPLASGAHGASCHPSPNSVLDFRVVQERIVTPCGNSTGSRVCQPCGDARADREASFLPSAGFTHPIACTLRTGQAADVWCGSKASFCQALVKVQAPSCQEISLGCCGSHQLTIGFPRPLPKPWAPAQGRGLQTAEPGAWSVWMGPSWAL